MPDLFDSNQISPGTKFMHELGENLAWFVKFKLNTDPIYQNVSFQSFWLINNLNFSAKEYAFQTRVCRGKESIK